jgi:phage FluMu gp28-like protein
MNIKLSAWQGDVYNSLADNRFIVIAAGRQSGKTELCVYIEILTALQESDLICWWVAPTFAISKIAFRRTIATLFKNKIQFNINKSELTISFTNGSVIYFKSCDNENSLRGESVNFIVVDEAAYMKEDVWTYVLRGTITATMAKVIFIGTPKGKNLFYNLYIRGQNREDGWVSFQFPSNKSPFFQEDWNEIKRLPLRVFQQEYLAEFIDDGGEVFRGIRDCIHGEFEAPNSKRKSYFAGVDLAKSVDYSVIAIMDNNCHVVAWDRFNDLSWNIQKQRIVAMCSKYNAAILLDSTGLGDPIFDDLQMANVPVEGYKFTNISKRQLVENLAIGIEKKELTFPEIPELINELSIFTFEQLPSGLLRYGSPDGMHDDCVIALALAYWKSSGNRYINSNSFGYGEDRVTKEMDF